ncbi:carboxypeptidase-like regulatory domain-containing protein [Edaphobacter modestus]|uniref:TonB-dependent receptor-like protein n=1 Tax=Edaphobacter modestus TaxID=388466 RepID=A0A4Q7YZL6_9BACT|nr:carboxypeptidase-like regulatory domain-containing protein [Edaphobacter modestus]RZU43432.1 TonB-dependent receptor-like protein [Edaphobacter modestus]
MRRFSSYVLALVCSFLMTAGLHAQTVNSQQISGAVSDASGAMVQNATVVVTNEGTGLIKEVRTSADGNYIALDLPVGTYTVTATAKGFKKVVIRNVKVDVGGKPSIPIALAVGEETQSVTVEADVVQMRTTSAEVGSVVTSEEATHLQLNGRNYIQLITLAPGVSSTVASGFALFGTYGVDGSSQSVNGSRGDTFNYFIDGVDNKDNGGGGNNFVNISPDALEQFKTAASSFDASYGGTSGASISVGIKNGTRDFHGLAYEYFRNDAIQAYAFQPLGTTNPVKPPLRYNNFGWMFGGPIFIPGHFNVNRDKLFFFVGQDFKRLRTSTITTTTVPTAAQKNGDFSAFPTSQWPINPATGQPFAGGIVPQCSGAAVAGCSTANGRALVNLFPTGNSNGGNSYNYGNFNVLNTQEYLFKIDYNMNEKNQISGHYVHDYYTSLGNPTNLINFQRQLPGLTSSVQWTRTINSKTVNTLTGSFSGNVISQTNGIAPNPQFGLTSILRSDNGMNYPTLFPASPDIPSVTTTGFTGLSATAINFNNYQRIYAGKDDFTRILGNHSLKTGIYAWRGRKNQTSIPAINGSFGFNNGITGQSSQTAANQALANELQGNFTTYQEGSNIQQVQARFTQIETYVQDDWMVSHRLTLNLGLRWQYMQPIFSTFNNGSGFRPDFYDPSHAATVDRSTGFITSNPYPYNGLVLPGSGFPSKAACCVSVYNNPAVNALFHNLPLGLVNTYWGAWAPRVGFAYDLTGRQSTVLRGGFGLSYERIEGNYYYGSVSQLPFTTVANVSNGNVDTIASAAPAAANPSTISNSPNQNLEPPRVKNWSIGVQQKVKGDTVAEFNYVGTSSANLSYYNNLNQAPAGTLQANPGVAANALRPYLGYQDIFESRNGAISNYHSFQARLLTRMRQGGTVSISYTWSKALTDGQAYNYSPQDSFNLRGDYGPASFNQPQILAISYVYPLPFWQRSDVWYKKALGGWTVSGITRIASGIPINVTQATNSATSGNTVTSVLQRPNLVGDRFAGARGKQYLNPAAFAIPAAGTYGNLQAYSTKGPLFNNWDASLQKSIPIWEQVAMDFRAEMFNVPNHLSSFTVSNTMGTGNFGQVTGTTDPRTMEFVLRVHF